MEAHFPLPKTASVRQYPADRALSSAGHLVYYCYFVLLVKCAAIKVGLINTTAILAEQLGSSLAATYRHYFGDREAYYATILDAGARLVIERISTSDALYHNMEHTVMVTLVGQDILRGKLLRKPVQPDEWLHFILSLVCHDVGYVRGVCSADSRTAAVIDETGSMMELPRGASDATLTPYHVTRGKLFVLERFSDSDFVNAERIARNIELTRFPVPDDGDHDETDTEAGLVRAADLIGQLADPRYLQKLNALYYEFLETGTAEKMNLKTPADLVDVYPQFYWNTVEPYIGEALEYLKLTSEGRQWIANLYSHVFSVEKLKRDVGPHSV
jgi:hypothetical protein